MPGALTLANVLSRATDLASELNELHDCGLAYGIGALGMALRADGRRDVEAFGAVLADMLAGVAATRGLTALHAEAALLSARCLEEAPDILQVLIELRLLRMRARQGELEKRAVAATPKASTQRGALAYLKSFAQQAAQALLE
jgi:hypothetical protein